MPTPEEIFARLMPGVDIKKAKRTKKGNPYWFEQGEFEPGTFGQRLYGKPHVRLSSKAKPWDLPHEEYHVDRLYESGGQEPVNPGFDAQRLSNLYASYGLDPDSAQYLAYAEDPEEAGARAAAGEPVSPRFQQLKAQVEALKARRAQTARMAPSRPSGGIGDPSRRRP